VKKKVRRSHWFRIREELPPDKASLLTLLSFLLPLATWAVVSYVPLIWHPDIKLQVSADRTDVTTVYGAGDHVSKAYFPKFADAVRRDNAAIRAARADGSARPGAPARRQNQKLLRHLAPIAEANGWIAYEQREDDAAIYQIWKDVATGARALTNPPISAENLAIIRENWAVLSAASPVFDPRALPDTPLLKLIPQGGAANPVYLPAPHEVVLTGWRDFTTPPGNGRPWMWQRLAASLKIVFGGFLLSCAFGIPLGILCGTYSFFSKLFEPFIDFFRYMPAPAFSTLLVAVLLAHDAPKIALVFVGTVFQMVLVISKTTRQLDVNLLEAAQTLGANPPQLLTRVVIPGILPDLYNDLRILLGWAWTWLVIAELIGVKSGLTEFIETQGRWRNFDSVFPIIILIGIIGFFTDQFLAWFRGIIFPYTRPRKAPGTGGLALAFSALFKRKPAVAAAAPAAAKSAANPGIAP
jgi:NitT/TauT family transport system permease protein